MNQIKKILIVNNSYPSEKYPTIYNFTHNQVKALQADGYDVRVIDVDLRSVRKKRHLGYIKDVYDGVIVYRYAFPIGTMPPITPKIVASLSYSFGKKLYKKVLKDNFVPDVIHAHFAHGGGNAGLAISKKYNVPLIVTEHSSKVLSMIDSYVKESKKVYDESNKIVAVSNALKEKICSIGEGRYDVQVIPNIINSKMFYIDNSVQKNKDFTFISVGNLIERKGHSFTIKAFKKVVEDYPSAKLIIIGGGSRQPIEKLINDLSLSNSVSLLGAVTYGDIADYYRKCHCFVLPSKCETFGMVYTEALLCGLPIIATECGGVDDIKTDENSIIVPIDDEESLSLAMKQMIENLPKYDKIKMSEDIKVRFGEKAFLNYINELYRGMNDKECTTL